MFYILKLNFLVRARERENARKGLYLGFRWSICCSVIGQSVVYMCARRQSSLSSLTVVTFIFAKSVY